VLVLLDMVMPRMNGAACFHALRKRRAVPILLVSGYADHEAARDLLASGADGFLEKPYTTEQLATEVDRILGRARAKLEA
jgi:CheY-like chemotaxis protein